MSKSEIEQIQSIESLKNQLDQAITVGAQVGNLETAQSLQDKIYHQVELLKDQLDPLRHYHSEIRHLLETDRARIIVHSTTNISKNKLPQHLKRHRIGISDRALAMLESKDTAMPPQNEALRLICFKPVDLGICDLHDFDSLYLSVKHFGLLTCPTQTAAELAPLHRQLQLGVFTYFGSDPIMLDRTPHVFSLHREGRKTWLISATFQPLWLNNSDTYIFRLP